MKYYIAIKKNEVDPYTYLWKKYIMEILGAKTKLHTHKS